MPTVTPLPSTPKSARASAAASWVSPSELTEPAGGRGVTGVGTALARSHPVDRAERPQPAGLDRDGDRLVAAAGVEDPRAGRAQLVDGRRAAP